MAWYGTVWEKFKDQSFIVMVLIGGLYLQDKQHNKQDTSLRSDIHHEHLEKEELQKQHNALLNKIIVEEKLQSGTARLGEERAHLQLYKMIDEIKRLNGELLVCEKGKRKK